MDNSFQKRPSLSPTLPLFWRLFLSLLLLLLITSAISVTMERWINIKMLESRMTLHVDHLLSMRQAIKNNLSVGDFKSVQNIYRQERGLRDQIIITNQQGVPLFSTSRFPSERSVRNHRPLNRNALANRQAIEDVKPNSDDYPALQDISVASPDGEIFTIQMQPRLPLEDLTTLRKNHFLLRFAIILLFSLLACYWFSRALSTRIKRLQHAVHRMGEGEYEAGDSLSHLGNDELGLLAKDIAQLAKKLIESELSRKQMLSDISHELRSPLARLEVASELARDHAPDAQQYLNRIQKESARMNELIAQIIHIQSLQMQRYVTPPDEYESVDIRALLDEIGQDVRFEFQHKKIEWKCLAQDTQHAYQLTANREQLHSAFENIVRNAFIHSKRQSIVCAAISTNKLSSKKSAIKITIIDQGPGIDDANLERIFHPFVRLDTSRQRPLDSTHNHTNTTIDTNTSTTKPIKEGGYGLGLSIAQAIISAHCGQISARNRDDGHKGLIIEVLLPTAN